MIAACRQLFPIRMMCRLLHVSPSGYYARQTRPKSRRARTNAELVQEIRRIHTESGEVYGSPKVWRGVEGAWASLWPASGSSAHEARGAPRHFVEEAVAKLQSRHPPRGRDESAGSRLCRVAAEYEMGTDITSIQTAEGGLYLAVVVDLFSRQVIGCAMQPQQDCELVIQAVRMAVGQRMTPATVIIHSDWGTQYTAHKFQAFLQIHGMVSSMSGVGSCYDNAVAESFFGLLKRERVHRRRYQTRAEARTDTLTISNGSTIANGVILILKGCPLGSMSNKSQKLLTNLSTKLGEDHLI